MTNSRTKGAVGEREVAALISDHLGFDCHRNLDQTRDGGHDLIGVPGWAVEVKRYKSAGAADYRSWWNQAVTQADQVNCLPVVIYRLDRQKWRCLVQLPGEFFPIREMEGVADVHFEAWAAMVRQTL